MPLLLAILSKLSWLAKYGRLILSIGSMILGELMNLKMPRLPIYVHALALLISALVAYRIGLASATHTVETQTETVTKFVTLPEVRYVVPPLPECAGFDFSGDVGGMAMDDFIIWAGELYSWAAGCSNALARVK